MFPKRATLPFAVSQRKEGKATWLESPNELGASARLPKILTLCQ